MKMHLVREMKKYGHVRIANAMGNLVWRWDNQCRRPTNIERMVGDLPRCVLEQILKELQRSA